MHFSPLLSFVLFTTLITAQSPIQVPLQDENLDHESIHVKACSIKLPTSYQQITRSSPTKSFPQNNIFNVTQTNGGKSNTDTLLRFSGIPPGSTGCQLAVSFTFQYPIYSSGNAQLNVYPIHQPILASDTYATYFPNGGRGTPKGSFLWATTTITGQPATLNSEGCLSDLGYLFQIASETADGAVTFADAGNNLSGIGGFYLKYNC